MANQITTTQNIARQVLPRLIDNLVMPNLCYKDFSNEFTQQGDTVKVRKPVKFVAQDFVDGQTVSTQDIKEEDVLVKLDKIATVDVKISAIEAATSIDDLNRLVIEPAAAALAEKINAAGLAVYKEIPNYAGSISATPDGLDDLAAIRKALNDMKVPFTGRKAVWDTAADSALSQIPSLVKVNEAGSPAGLREGEIGRVFGIDNYMSQAVAVATDGELTAGGTGATGVKVEANVTANNTISLVSNATASGTLTGAVKAGDIVTLGGKNYLVTADATASSNKVSVKLDKAVTATAGDAVAVVSGGTQNLAFHENAIAFVTRPLNPPAGVESYTTSYNGISLRVVRGYDIDTKTEKLSIDVLYAYKVVYPEMALRYLGQ